MQMTSNYSHCRKRNGRAPLLRVWTPLPRMAITRIGSLTSSLRASLFVDLSATHANRNFHFGPKVSKTLLRRESDGPERSAMCHWSRLRNFIRKFKASRCVATLPSRSASDKKKKNAKESVPVDTNGVKNMKRSLFGISIHRQGRPWSHKTVSWLAGQKVANQQHGAKKRSLATFCFDMMSSLVCGRMAFWQMNQMSRTFRLNLHIGGHAGRISI